MEARLIWHADLDPLTLPIRISPLPQGAALADGIDPARLAPWLTLVAEKDGEQAVLSDGCRRIRLDVLEGSLRDGGPVQIHYGLCGLARAGRQIVALRRFLDLVQRGGFARGLYPLDPRTGRMVTMLRVHDALAEGMSYRDIGRFLFGEDRVRGEWDGPSDSLRGRVRRLARDALAMARGGWRQLLHRERH
jgi:hypothetical protein